MPGAAVTFTVTAGGGNVSPSTPITTDATGIATLGGWTLGPSVGGNTVDASVALIAATVNFHATGTLRIARIAVGTGHSCALTVDGVAYCWGDNTDGGLGDNSLTSRLIPTAVTGGHTFADLGGGGSQLRADRRRRGLVLGLEPLGAGQRHHALTDSVPQPVSGGMVFQAITTGNGSGRQTCAINSAGGLLLGR